MQSKIFPVRILLLIVLIIIISLITFLSYFTHYNLIQKVQAFFVRGAPTSQVIKQVNEKKIVASQIPHAIINTTSLPTRLKIPVIGVNANVLHLGLTPLGAMDAPKGPYEVSWYDLGVRPGDVGSAVIAGHYGPWKNGAASVFDDLNKLQKGDKISVLNEDGSEIFFIVRDTKTFLSTDNAQTVFLSADGKSHLNLITCQGIWNKSDKSYSNRYVVFTDME